MANQPDQNLDPVSAAWNNSKQLRDQLAAKAGTPDINAPDQPANQTGNQNISLLDIPKQALGEATSFVGDAIKNYVPTVRKVVDGTFEQPASDSLASAVTGKTPEQLHKDGLLGLNDDAKFVGVDPSSNPIRNAPGYVLDKAADAAQFVGDKAGGAVEHIGGLIKDTVSDTGKQKLNEEWMPENGGKSAFTDPQAWAMKMSNAIGMVGGVFATGGVGNTTNSAIKGMVKKSMLKRGASEDFANSVADLTEKNMAGQSVILGGGVGMSLSATADQARESTNNLSADQLMQSPTFVQNWKDIASDPQYQSLSATDRFELARKKTADTAADAASASPSAIAGAVTSNIIGDIPLFKMISGEPANAVGNVISRALQNGVKTAPVMGAGMAVDQAARQYAVNTTENQVNGTNIDPLHDVARTALESGIDGATTGLVVGGLHGAMSGKPKDASNTDDNSAAPKTDNAQQQSGSDSDVTVQQSDQVAPKPDDIANTPAYMRSGQELSPELEQARQQAINNAWRDQSAQQSAEQSGVLQPRDVQVTGNPDEPAFLRTQQNNPTGRDTSTLQDANPYTDTQGALANGGAPTAEELIQQSIQQGDQGKTPHESGLTGNLILSDKQGGLPATTEQTSGMTVDGQSSEIIPESRGLGYNNQINMPGEAGNGINDNYVPPVTQSRQTADQSLGIESTHDPRSPVAQSIESAGQQADAVFNALKTVRVTKRGQPFSSQKEAQLASRKTETPIELPTGGYGIVDKTELEQAQANQSPTDTVVNDGAINEVKNGEQIPTQPASQDIPGNTAEGNNGELDRQPRSAVANQQSRMEANGNTDTYGVHGNNEEALSDGRAENTALNEQPIADRATGDHGGGLRSADINNDWVSFSDDSGSLNIPRSEMPQIKTADRGAMVNFLNARGVSHQEETIPAKDLKPTQAEFSPSKVEVAKQDGNDRAVLVSSDGYVMDGHHQWIAKQDIGGDIRAIRLNAPAKELIPLLHEFPSSTTDVSSEKSVESGDASSEIADQAVPKNVSTQEPAIGAKTEPASVNIIEHKTGKGKTLRGVVRTDLTVNEAKAIDPYTFKKDGGYFIREQHLNKLPLEDVSQNNNDAQQNSGPTSSNSGNQDSVSLVTPHQSEVSKRADKLRSSANRIITAAQNEQNRSRLTNTPKRAREAGNAINAASRHESVGRTMLNIADEIERNGESKLKGIDSRATVDELEGIIARSVYEADKHKSYSEQERNREPSEKDLTRAKMPEVSVYHSWLSDAAATLEKKSREGNVRLISNLRKLSDKAGSDSVLIQPSQFGMIEETNKKLKSLKEYSRLSDTVDRISAVKRLNRAGINNNSDLRDMLKEYIRHRDGVKKEDPVKAAERALVGQKVGIDFFPTPKPVAKKMAELAEIKPGMKVLEPSAGNGNLADAAKEAGAKVDVAEISPQLRNLLELKGHNTVESDFNDLPASEDYDAILMNPPFSNRNDAKHIMKAYDHLKPGGKMVAIAGEGVFSGSDKAAVNFREWLDDRGADVEKLDSGTFKDKSLLATTGANARIIVIAKGEIDGGITDPILNSAADPSMQGASKIRSETTVTKETANKGGFSLSTMPKNEAEISGKGMTKPEAAMVAKEWLRKFKTDINVEVVKDQSEFEAALADRGFANSIQSGEMDNAAYLPDSKTILINASAIQNPKRLKQIMRHEILVHHGLRYVIGEDAYTKIINAIARGYETSPAIRDAVDTVTKNYADKDMFTQMEEAFAHYAETQPADSGVVGRLWQRIVGMVKSALQKVNFIHVNESEQALNSVLQAIAKNMREGIENGVLAQKTDNVMFSHGSKSDPFKPDPADADNYREQLEKAMRSQRSGEIMIDVGRTPEVLRTVGAPDLSLRISRDTIRKATNGVKHDVPMSVIEKLPELLHDPISIFDSKTHPGDSLVVLLDATDKSGRSVVSAIQLKVVAGKYLDINRIASIHGRPEAQINQWLSDGLARYTKENHRSSLRTGLQLPLGSSIDGHEQSIITADDIRNKSKPLLSRSMTADDDLMAKLGLGPKPDLAEKTKAQLDTLRQSDMNTVKSWITRVLRKANTEILDALAPIKYAEDSAGKLDASDSGYVAARMAAGSSSVMQATMLYGIPEWKDGVIQRKNGTGEKDSMLGIFEGLGSDLHNWLAWMAGHRAEILMNEGRENLLTNEDISALKAKGIGKEAAFMAAKDKWNKLNRGMLDLAQEAGLFTAEDRAKFESEWYVPFFREAEDGDVMGPYKKNGIANQSSGIKKLKGGTANVNDILENIFQTTSKLIDSSMKNMAAQKVVYNLSDTDLIEVITKPNMLDIKAALQNKQNLMMVKMDGENHLIRVNDPALFKAMTMIDSTMERDPFRKIAMKAKHILTAGVTVSPDFMLRNFLRDAASTWAINEDGFKPIIDSIRGVKKAWGMDDSSINMMFSGASFMGGNLRGNDPEAMASVVRKTLRRKGMSPERITEYQNSLITTGKKAKEILSDAFEHYERFGEAVENGSREAVYEAAIKAGKSHAQAAFEARDLMDFSMLGSSKIMRYMVDVLPFFNARMQGLGKLGRAFSDNKKQIAQRGGMIAAASLGLLALNWDDNRYNDLPDWDKDMNWHFWLGDQHFRIPKPFEIGLIFGTLPERMARAMGGKDTAGKFGQVVASNLLSTIETNPIPQVVRPLTEAFFNYDMFRSAPIENMSDLNVAPEARYDERTSLLMRELGQLTGLSPKKIEHVIDGYTGTIGAYVIGMGDAIMRASGDYGKSPSFRADELPIVKSVWQGSGPAKSSQAMTDYYQLLNEANQIYDTIRQYQKEGRMDDANQLLDENRNKLAGRGALTSAQKQFRAVRNEMELIQRDKTLTSDQKRVRIDNLLAKRNNFASKLMRRFGTEL